MVTNQVNQKKGNNYQNTIRTSHDLSNHSPMTQMFENMERSDNGDGRYKGSRIVTTSSLEVGPVTAEMRLSKETIDDNLEFGDPNMDEHAIYQQKLANTLELRKRLM